MTRLEDITRGCSVRGILPEGLVSVLDVKWIGTVAIEVTYKDSAGRLGNELLYRDREPTVEIAQAGQPWSFDGDGAQFRLVSEAHRIQLAHLFDPLLAVHTSLVDPLPHQITAVYDEMLPRQPLRFLLADDPGAGKTIMTGLLIKELIARGDLKRCLIVSPGSLVEQWQDEMDSRFHVPFEIMTNDKLEAARTGNWFHENPLAICRLDKLSRDDDVRTKLGQTDWDLIVCDEAHKLSATYFGNEIKYTKRYRLGQLLATLTRHFLLLTATPHNGKEADFQLFMALLDGDRFEGKFRDGVHLVDTSDMMRRLVKEQLLKFDGTPLFPERIAYTVTYSFSNAEADLYGRVTTYVREEFNRAEALENDGRKGTVGFALTILQRRLASSPEAIYQSLKRRRERLEKRLREEQLLKRGEEVRIDLGAGLPSLNQDDIDDIEDAPDAEVEEAEERILDQATAARTIVELHAEIQLLADLEKLALRVRQSGTDRKWEELSRLLQNNSEMFDAHGHRRKLVIFTEHRDTLNYLTERIRALIGRPEALVIIHGSVGREDRRKAQEAFMHDKEVEILVATDAAGEGINLQRAHLMVNYDLPWNPNRLEQRFGRIHRIGQTEVCHLWNLVAKDSREGEVYHRVLEKLDEERKALGGKVFDVLGQLTFEDRPLRELLLEAVRYGDRPEVKARLFQVVDKALDRKHLQELVEGRALTHDAMDVSRVRAIREDMERAEARRLQPHFIAGFFIEAFKGLGGAIHEREPKRYEIKHVPSLIRNRDRQIGRGQPVLQRYERITFEKDLISPPGKPLAAFVCPGHSLLDATLDLVIERHRDLLKRGAILVDDKDQGEEIRALLYLEHSVQDARTDRSGTRRIVSKRLQFVEVGSQGNGSNGGYSPYLDYRPLAAAESEAMKSFALPEWVRSELENLALEYAAIHLVPEHLGEVRRRKEELITKTLAAVKDRLTKEVNYWDHRATQLKDQELAGRVNAKLNSGLARQRADDLATRLQKRTAELEQERKLSALPPVILGGALIVPVGLLQKLQGTPAQTPPTFAQDTVRSERLAMQAVIEAERSLGYVPRDVSPENRGYDVESSIPGTGRLRFIEVKGRVKEARTVTMTKNEILTVLNKPEDFILAIAVVDGDTADLRYVRRPFTREPDFGATSVNYELTALLALSQGAGMSKTPKKGKPRNVSRQVGTASPPEAEFDEVLRLIDDARSHALGAVNTVLMQLYWTIGEYISERIAADGWGQGSVKALAEHIGKRRPNAIGFSARNVWRMMQFYENYRNQPKLSALLTELSWTSNLLILGKCKRVEEREFYLRMAHGQKWPSRELERQINGALFERAVLSPAKLSAPLTELHPDAASVFKDTYLIEFLDLPPKHSEADLQRGLVEQLKQFLIELGRDFCFVGSQYPLQVGNRDFALDLLFFNRALNCLVAFEIKIDEFQPEHLGKLEFYLEALDRDVRKPHERPSIGVLLCATKNQEVVEYALSRAMSPALVAEYQTRLPDKKLLQAKLHEFYELAQEQAPLPEIENHKPTARRSARSKRGTAR